MADVEAQQPQLSSMVTAGQALESAAGDSTLSDMEYTTACDRYDQVKVYLHNNNNPILTYFAILSRGCCLHLLRNNGNTVSKTKPVPTSGICSLSVSLHFYFTVLVGPPSDCGGLAILIILLILYLVSVCLISLCCCCPYRTGSTSVCQR